MPEPLLILQAEPLLTVKEIIAVLILLLTNVGTFYGARALTRKTNVESDSLSADIIKKLYAAWEEMRLKEDGMFHAKRLVDNQLEECLEGNEDCRDCMNEIKMILDGFNETDDVNKSQEILKEILKLVKKRKEQFG